MCCNSEFSASQRMNPALTKEERFMPAEGQRVIASEEVAAFE